MALAGIAAAVALMARAHEPPTPGQILALAALLVTAATACGVLLAAITLSRQLSRLGERATAIDQQTAILAEQSVARTQADTYARNQTTDAADVKQMLAEIRECLLLPGEERARRFQELMDGAFRQHLAMIDTYVASHDFHRAREELANLASRFGADERTQKAQQRIEHAAEAARAGDITEISKRVEDLMGSARWDEAHRLARDLAAKYPLDAASRRVAERVMRERTIFEQKHRERMHQEIQQFVTQRRWREALQAGRQFLETFPAGVDADSLRAQMETLEANADIQARQSFERRIKEHIQQHQYWDALALVRRIMQEHPLSPQANALRGQLPRLEELARQQAPQK
jgi:hypothetical protein